MSNITAESVRAAMNAKEVASMARKAERIAAIEAKRVAKLRR